MSKRKAAADQLKSLVNELRDQLADSKNWRYQGNEAVFSLIYKGETITLTEFDLQGTGVKVPKRIPLGRKVTLTSKASDDNDDDDDDDEDSQNPDNAFRVRAELATAKKAKRSSSNSSSTSKGQTVSGDSRKPSSSSSQNKRSKEIEEDDQEEEGKIHEPQYHIQDHNDNDQDNGEEGQLVCVKANLLRTLELRFNQTAGFHVYRTVGHDLYPSLTPEQRYYMPEPTADKPFPEQQQRHYRGKCYKPDCKKTQISSYCNGCWRRGIRPSDSHGFVSEAMFRVCGEHFPHHIANECFGILEVVLKDMHIIEKQDN